MQKELFAQIIKNAYALVLEVEDVIGRIEYDDIDMINDYKRAAPNLFSHVNVNLDEPWTPRYVARLLSARDCSVDIRVKTAFFYHRGYISAQEGDMIINKCDKIAKWCNELIKQAINNRNIMLTEYQPWT